MEAGGEREKERSGLAERDRVSDRNGNGVGQKWLLEKLKTSVFLKVQINRIKKLSIKLGGFQIFEFFLGSTFILITLCFITKHI
jgi:hypothetical protein